MARAIKYIFIGLLSVVILAGSAIAALVFWVDPNIFKDEIEKLAADQGLILHLDGDLAWQIYPDIQIALGAASLAIPDASTTPNSSTGESTEIVRFEQAQLAVALKPLLQKNIVIKGITLKGLNANLVVDEQGVGNWSNIGKQSASAAKEPTTESSAPQQLGIQKFQLANSTVHYRNAQTGQTIALEKLNVNGEDIQLTNKAFPLEFSAAINFKDPLQSLAADISLSAKVQVNDTMDNIIVNDGDISLSAEHRNEQAQVSAKTRLKLAATANFKDALVWSLSELAVQNTTMQYAAKDGTKLELKSLDVSGAIQPGGDANALSVASALNYSATNQSPISTKIKLDTRLKVDAALNNFTASNTVLAADVGDEILTLKGDANASVSPLVYQASLQLSPANLRNIAKTLAISLPEMAEPSTLSNVGVKAKIKGDDKLISISDLNATLDTTTISGDASLPMNKEQVTKLNLAIDKINLDHYLPPKPPADASQANDKTTPPAGSTPSSDELPLPRELLNAQNISAKLKIGELVVSQLPFKDLNVTLAAKQGLSRISPFSGLVYDSPFKIETELDTRAVAAKLHIKANSDQLPLGKVLTALEISQELSGLSNVNLDLNTSGTTISGLKKNLDGNIALSGQKLRLANMNIERAFCQLVTRLQQETFDPNNWPLYTDLQDTTTKIVITKGVAKIEQFNAGVTKLALRGSGSVDLNNDSFDVVLNSRLAQADQEAMACKINNEKLLNRDIPIRCKASFGSIGATSCLPDFRVIEDIAKEKAKNKIEEKTQELIDRKMGGENGEAAKQLFNQFFKK